MITAEDRAALTRPREANRPQAACDHDLGPRLQVELVGAARPRTADCHEAGGPVAGIASRVTTKFGGDARPLHGPWATTTGRSSRGGRRRQIVLFVARHFAPGYRWASCWLPRRSLLQRATPFSFKVCERLLRVIPGVVVERGGRIAAPSSTEGRLRLTRQELRARRRFR
jgi:hypothetical protein